MIAFVNEKCFWEVLKEASTTGVVFESNMMTEQDVDTYTLYNLSSVINRGARLSALVPPTTLTGGDIIDFDNEKTFDMMYARYLIENDGAFVQMFSIINNLYLGGSSIVLVGESEYKDTLTESLIKFIQQRYGIAPIRVINEFEDWFSYDDDSNFNLIGVYNLDIDKERYALLTTDFDALNKIIEEE